MSEQIGAKRFHESDGTDEWRVLGDGACTFFRTGSFSAGARLVAAIGALPGVDDHHPDVDLRGDGVTVRLITRTADYFGMSTQDVELARRISAVARELGLAGDPSGVQTMLIVPGAPSTSAIMPFWKAVLGYEPRGDSPDEDLVDPHDRGVPLWFEGMDEPRGGRGGAIHIAVFVPYEAAEARVAAAVAAGGRIVFDRAAPAWWTLEDAYGNQADISTTQGRG